MFALSERDLGLRILGCADGPASFNAVLTRRGGSVVSVDPIYQFSKEQLRARIDETYDRVLAEVRANQSEFVWTHFESVEALGGRAWPPWKPSSKTTKPACAREGMWWERSRSSRSRRTRSTWRSARISCPSTASSFRLSFTCVPSRSSAASAKESGFFRFSRTAPPFPAPGARPFGVVCVGVFGRDRKGAIRVPKGREPDAPGTTGSVCHWQVVGNGGGGTGMADELRSKVEAAACEGIRRYMDPGYKEKRMLEQGDFAGLTAFLRQRAQNFSRGALDDRS